MLKYVLILPALVLLTLGLAGLYNANRESQADFIIAGLELAGAVLLIGLAVVLRRRSVPEPEIPAADSADRAEVIERLQRHTEAIRMAEEREHAARQNPEPMQSVAGPVPQPIAAELSVPDQSEPDNIQAPVADAADSTGGCMAEGEIVGQRAQMRLPAIMLLNVPQRAGAADIESAPPLGPKAEVLARLREILPDLDVDATGRSHHTGPDHSVRLDLGAREVVHTIVIEAGGEAGVSLVRWLLETTGWRAFVPKSGRFVEADGLEDIAMRAHH
jgi:hypothetical protein